MNVAELFASLALKPDKQSFSTGEKLIQSLSASAGRLAGAFAGFFAVDKIADFVGQTLSAVPAIGDLEDQTGLAAESIQRFGFAVGQSGSDAQTFEVGLRKLVQVIGHARDGNEEAAKSFAKLGVKLSDAKGAKGTEEILNEVIDAIAGIDDVAKRAAVSAELFGRQAGPGLLPALAQGSAGLSKLSADLAVLTRSEIDAIGSADDKVNAVTARFDLLGKRLVVKLLPAIDKLVDLMNELVTAAPKLLKHIRSLVVGGIVFMSTKLIYLSTVAVAGAIKSFIAGAAANALFEGSFWLTVTAIDAAFAALARFAAMALRAFIIPAVALAAIIFAVDELTTMLDGGRSTVEQFAGKWGDLSNIFLDAAVNGGEGLGFFERALAGIGAGVTFVLHVFDSLIDGAYRVYGALQDFLFDPLSYIKALLIDISKSSLIAPIVQYGSALKRDVVDVAGAVQEFISPSTSIANVNAPINVTTTISGNAPPGIGDAIGRSVSGAVDSLRRTAVDLVGGG